MFAAQESYVMTCTRVRNRQIAGAASAWDKFASLQPAPTACRTALKTASTAATTAPPPALPPSERCKLPAMTPLRSPAAAFFLSGCVSALLASPSAAWANDVSDADDYFTKGAAHFDAKRYNQGCPLLEKSYRLDPQGGALFMLAQCEEARGRIATALARFDEYLAFYDHLPPAKRARQGDRDRQARAAQKRLAPEVPLLTVELPPTAPSGTAVKRNGHKIDPDTLGKARPVDPGEYVVTTHAPDGGVSKAWITLDKREKRGLVLNLPPPMTKQPVTSTRPFDASASPAAEAAHRRAWLIGGGISLAVVGLGTGIGLSLASNAKGAAADQRASGLSHEPGYAYACASSPPQWTVSPTNQPLCNEIAQMRGRQVGMATGAIVGYTASGLMAASTAAFALWPRSHRPSTEAAVLPFIGPGGGGMLVVGSF
jgi:hypothetical protein